MLSFLLLTFFGFSAPEPTNSKEVLKNMYTRYHTQWYKTLTFVQKNEFYKGDTLAGTSIWYEAIEYPKNFRIDLGDISEGNAVIFRNDSIYSFRAGEMKKALPRKNTLTFLLGGMYFLPYEEVLGQMKAEGYDLSKGYKSLHKGKEVWIIGADSAGTKSNQLWVDLENLYVVRVLTYKDSKEIDAVFEGHIQFSKGWCESKVTFYIDRQLYQMEYYSDIETDVALDSDVFNPKAFGKVHWMVAK